MLEYRTFFSTRFGWDESDHEDIRAAVSRQRKRTPLEVGSAVANRAISVISSMLSSILMSSMPIPSADLRFGRAVIVLIMQKSLQGSDDSQRLCYLSNCWRWSHTHVPFAFTATLLEDVEAERGPRRYRWGAE